MINKHRYTKTIVLGEEILKDTSNKYRMVNQHKTTVKTDNGEEASVSVTLQILEDNAEPLINKKTGLETGNNVLETMEVSIIGATYPLPYKKGDIVALENFEQDLSYYFDYNLLLRFRGIKLLKSANPQGQGGVYNATAGQTK